VRQFQGSSWSSREASIAVNHGRDSAPELCTGKAVCFQRPSFGAEFLTNGTTAIRLPPPS